LKSLANTSGGLVVPFSYREKGIDTTAKCFGRLALAVQDRDWWREAQQRRKAHAMPERSTAAQMRRSTLGIALFWLVVMSVLYLAMDRFRAPRPAVVARSFALVGIVGGGWVLRRQYPVSRLLRKAVWATASSAPATTG
jgi:hypothetical protein